ncbi:MAG: divalent-cation tolerance protein CutA [Actinomycetota bacterium]
MDELVQLFTTFESKDDALTMAHAAVDARAAACAQIIGPITSVYRWNGEVQEASEFLCLFKVPGDRIERLATFLRERHPYETPELTAVPSSFVDGRYLQWAETVTAD